MKLLVHLHTRLLIALLLCCFGQTVSANEQSPGYYVFFKKPQDWAKVYLYSWYRDGGKNQETSGPWPGKALSDVSGWYRGFIEENAIKTQGRPINIVFSNGQGQQTPDLIRANNGWYIWRDKGELVNRWYDANPEEKLFDLTVTHGQGSGRYSPGSLVKVQALNEEDGGAESLFLGWEGDAAALLNDSKSPSAQLQMPERNISLIARFENLADGQGRYTKLCQSCHGAQGQGGVGPALKISGPSCPSCQSDATLIDRIAKTMPQGTKGSCTGECARSIARYIRFGLNAADPADCSQPIDQASPRQLRLLTKREYASTVKEIFGIERLDALRFWPEPALVRGYNNNAEASLASDRHVLVFAQAAEEIARQRSIEDLTKSVCGSDQSCSLRTIGLQILRRPLTAAEEGRYLDLWRKATRGSQSVLASMLQSAPFLYRSEMGTFIAPANVFSLDSYEIASALAYDLTGLPPDKTLLALAADGSLRRGEVRRAEALRLLQTAEARDTFGDFALQWLGVGGLPFVTRDATNFTATIRRDMLEETQRFVSDIIFEQKGSVQDLYRSESSFLSKDLARYYKVEVPASDWDRVGNLGARRGLLGQGSILASYANSGEASPIKRGVFVRNRLLCQDLPPPPANVDTTIPPPTPGLTIRERLEKHISQGKQGDGSNACFSCHQYIDKLGFGFESFDAAARLQTVYPEKPGEAIDVSGEVKGLESLADPKISSFANQVELGDLLGASRRAKECFGTQYFRYMAGRIETSADQCALREPMKILSGDGRILDYLAALVAADHYIFRR